MTDKLDRIIGDYVNGRLEARIKSIESRYLYKQKANIDLIQAKSKKVNALLSLIYLEKVYPFESIIYQRKRLGLKLLERVKRNKENYKGNRNLVAMFNILNKVVDFL
jgi:hypothetical protein